MTRHEVFYGRICFCVSCIYRRDSWVENLLALWMKWRRK